MAVALITGSNRGLGFEFVRQYAASGWQIIATCRNPDQADALKKLAAASDGAIEIHRLEVTNPEEIRALARTLKDRPIDLLIANAGINAAYGDPVTPESFELVMRTNVLGPLLVVQGLVDNVAISEKRMIAFISSRMGSIGLIDSGGALLYRASKAALNAAMKTLSHDLKDRGIATVSLHPGWVRTDMGGGGADLAPDKSVADMIRVLGRITHSDSGRFFNHSGEELTW